MAVESRPNAVTVTAWIIIAFNAMALSSSVRSYQMFNNGEFDRIYQEMPPTLREWFPKPTITQMIVGGFFLVVQAACGVLMLRGFGVGRSVYVVAIAANTVAALVMKIPLLFIVPGLFVQAVIIYFLYKPSANRWYRLEADRRAGLPETLDLV
jgi:hypothetical protein